MSDTLSIPNKKHPLYPCYMNMIYRCTHPQHGLYEWYGGRGITVCEHWMESYENFYHWAIGAGWQEDLDIDRIDNNGNYEPSNCRFVTHKRNMRNRRNTKYITWRGLQWTLPDLLDELVTLTSHISRDVLRERILNDWDEADWLQPKYYQRNRILRKLKQHD